MLPLLRSLRPRQWIKNLVVFAGVSYGGLAGDPDSLLRATLAFLLFCVLSSAVYLGNDVADRERDRQHPVKRFRPIASGALPVRTALAAGTVLLVAALAGAFQLGPRTGQAYASYLLLQVLYTARLKHLPVVDVLCITAGFLLRVLAGAFAVKVRVSPWLVLCSGEVALLLALCKRRAELGSAGARGQRPSLAGYAIRATSRAIVAVAALTFLSYCVYAFGPGWLPEIELSRAGEMRWTVPFVGLGLLRYLHLVFRHQRGERPEILALTDPLLILIGLGYLASAAWSVYGQGSLS